MKYILRDNLIVALHTAIQEQENRELAMGYTSESAYLAGLISSLEELKNNNLQIKY